MIRILSRNDVDLNSDDKKRLFDLMIHAYAVTENDIWGENYFRLEKGEFFNLLEEEQFFIAFKNEKIVGSVMLYRKTKDTFGFGLLNIDFNEKGQNIGKKLIKTAEDFARYQNARTMQLEVLRTAQSVSVFKVWLAKWYVEQGYQFYGTFPFEYIEPDRPEKKQIMISQAVFDIYRKSL